MKQVLWWVVTAPGMRCYRLTQTPYGHIFLILVIGTSTFHSTNGIRLIFTHSGKWLGMPGRPDYPYNPSSLNYREKSGIWVALIFTSNRDVIWKQCALWC